MALLYGRAGRAGRLTAKKRRFLARTVSDRYDSLTCRKAFYPLRDSDPQELPGGSWGQELLLYPGAKESSDSDDSDDSSDEEEKKPAAPAAKKESNTYFSKPAWTVQYIFSIVNPYGKLPGPR